MHVVIVPGWNDSGPGHWQTLWEKKFKGTRIQQKNWFKPNWEDWIQDTVAQIAALDGPVVIAAHSLGCFAVAGFAARGRTDRVIGALLVAPPDLEQENLPSPLVDFRKIPLAELPFPSVLVSSTNDPWCSEERAKRLAKTWGSQHYSLGAKGHINIDAGFGLWPEGEKLLAQLVGQHLPG
jgi:predicted alpha/beta hydrolase family esterase